MPTMSEEYDKKLRSDLYLAMIQLHDDIFVYLEANAPLEPELQRVFTNAREACDNYFRCIEGQRDV